jgi:hypothetical protein
MIPPGDRILAGAMEVTAPWEHTKIVTRVCSLADGQRHFTPHRQFDASRFFMAWFTVRRCRSSPDSADKHRILLSIFDKCQVQLLSRGSVEELINFWVRVQRRPKMWYPPIISACSLLYWHSPAVEFCWSTSWKGLRLFAYVFDCNILSANTHSLIFQPIGC